MLKTTATISARHVFERAIPPLCSNWSLIRGSSPFGGHGCRGCCGRYSLAAPVDKWGADRQRSALPMLTHPLGRRKQDSGQIVLGSCPGVVHAAHPRCHSRLRQQGELRKPGDRQLPPLGSCARARLSSADYRAAGARPRSAADVRRARVRPGDLIRIALPGSNEDLQFVISSVREDGAAETVSLIPDPETPSPEPTRSEASRCCRAGTVAVISRGPCRARYEWGRPRTPSSGL
jgi:hypothetical protein